MRLYTIGFTKKSAERFFSLLRDNQVTLLVDTRLKPDTQLSGFAKKGDLPFFMREIVRGSYIHLPVLAPSDEVLSEYRKTKRWDDYVARFERLMDERNVPAVLDRRQFERNACCLLCSEHTADQCHRRLVAERLAREWGDIKIIHL